MVGSKPRALLVIEYSHFAVFQQHPTFYPRHSTLQFVHAFMVVIALAGLVDETH